MYCYNEILYCINTVLTLLKLTVIQLSLPCTLLVNGPLTNSVLFNWTPQPSCLSIADLPLQIWKHKIWLCLKHKQNLLRNWRKLKNTEKLWNYCVWTDSAKHHFVGVWHHRGEEFCVYFWDHPNLDLPRTDLGGVCDRDCVWHEIIFMNDIY